jgi:dihydroxy-acid dehydratase
MRSGRWFGGADLAGFIHRSSIHAEGISRAALAGRPVVGVCNSWSELVSCNLHFRSLAEAVKRGVLLVGGLPLEFPAIALGENLMKPTTMLFRNLMSMDVEECIRAYPFDAVVLIGGCDKTIPAQLMGAASADVPAIMVTGGPAEAAWFRGRPLAGGTDLWHYADELRAGRMTEEEFAELEAAATPSFGHCNEMGTASTMSALTEALGMALPGTATVPAVDAARLRAAEATGRRAVGLAEEQLRPSAVLTAKAFDNAITLLAAIGGGTNAVVHLLALAGRVGVPLGLDRFHELAARTPLLVNVRPSGDHLVEDLHRAGGVPGVLKELEALLHLEAVTVTGRALREELPAAPAANRDLIAPLDTPFGPTGSISVVLGSLAPRGALVKRSAASASLLRHRGQAARARRHRSGADLRRADERHGVRHGRAARRARGRRRRTACGGADRRSDRARRRRPTARPRRPGRGDRRSARPARTGGGSVPPRVRRALRRPRPPGRRGLRLRLPARRSGRARRERALRPARGLGRRLVSQVRTSRAR